MEYLLAQRRDLRINVCGQLGDIDLAVAIAVRTLQRLEYAVGEQTVVVKA